MATFNGRLCAAGGERCSLSSLNLHSNQISSIIFSLHSCPLSLWIVKYRWTPQTRDNRSLFKWNLNRLLTTTPAPRPSQRWHLPTWIPTTITRQLQRWTRKMICQARRPYKSHRISRWTIQTLSRSASSRCNWMMWMFVLTFLTTTSLDVENFSSFWFSVSPLWFSIPRTEYSFSSEIFLIWF